MLKTALVALDGSPGSGVAATLAMNWARRFGARLLAVGVVDEPAIHGGEAVPLGGGGYKKARDEARVADAHVRVVEFLSEFRTRCAARGIDAGVIEAVGDPVEQITWEAQRCDVVILARETHFHFETEDRPDRTLGQLLRTSPRPLVVVPPVVANGQRVLVAYGGGREVARTLQAFVLLGLAAGETIDLVSVYRDSARAEATLRVASAFLTSHEQPHSVSAIVSSAAPSEVLLEEVRRRQSRMVVIGAHGHHPVRDLFATSVTRAVLDACPVPIFTGA